jgi:pyridoxamine-phosphate oxidase
MTAFGAWLDLAIEVGVHNPEDAVLATVDADGSPSTRTLGLRAWDERGFVFFINYATRKGRDLNANARAAATFYWRELSQQVNVTGSTSRLSEDGSDQLWIERGPIGPAASLASRQGERLLDEVRLRQTYDAMLAAMTIPPRPPQHRGFILVPDSMEFWRAMPDRLHHRLHYARTAQGWTNWKLQP